MRYVIVAKIDERTGRPVRTAYANTSEKAANRATALRSKYPQAFAAPEPAEGDEAYWIADPEAGTLVLDEAAWNSRPVPPGPPAIADPPPNASNAELRTALAEVMTVLREARLIA